MRMTAPRRPACSTSCASSNGSFRWPCWSSISPAKTLTDLDRARPCAAPSRDHIPLQLTQIESALTLSVLTDPPPNSTDPSPAERVHQILAQQTQPISLQRLRQLCGLRTATVSTALNQLLEQGLVVRGADGYQLKPP